MKNSLEKRREQISLFEKVIWRNRTCIVTNASIGRGRYIEVSPIGENKYYQVTPDEINFVIENFTLNK